MQQVDNTKKNALKQQIAQICAGKNARQFDFLANKKSSYPHFYLSILSNFFKFLYFSEFYVALISIKMLFTTNQRGEKDK